MTNTSLLKEHISDAYAYHKVVVADGEVVDYIFLDINDKFTEFTGMGKEVLNKKVTDVLPGIEDSNFDWIGTYGEIAQNGGEKSFQAYSEPLEKWYEIKVFSDKQGYFVTLFQDITDYEEEKLSDKILNYTIKCQHLSVGDLDYDFFTESIKEITGASYVALNMVMQENQDITITKSVSGISDKIRRLLEKFDFQPEGAKWKTNHESFGDKDKLTCVNNFIASGFVSDKPLLEKVLKQINKISPLGDLYNMEMSYLDDILGSVSIIMPKGVSLKSKELVEMYINHISATLKRLQVEKDLIDQVKEQELLLDNIEAQVWYLKDIETYGKVNKAHADFFSVSKSDFEHKTLWEIKATKEEVETCIEGNKRVFEEKSKLHTEELVKNGEGEERLLAISKTPKLDQNGEVEFVVCSADDITEQKQAEIELKQTKTLLEGLFESIQDGISVLNSDFTIRYTNNTIKTWHESDLPLEGKKCYQVYHKQELPCDPCPSIRCLETGKVEVEEIQAQTDIGWKWTEIFSYPLYEKGFEKPTGVVEFIRDITEKKEWEKQLIDTQRLLEGALNAVPDVIGIQYPDHTIERYNQAGYEMLNMTHEEVKGKKCYELIGRTSECDQCATSEALKTKKLETVEKYFPELNIYLNARANPVLNEAGEIKYIVEQLQDVTNYKKTLNALRESEEKFRSYVENANDIIFTVNDKAVFTYISPNWENITGYELEESVGRSVYEFIYSVDIDSVASAAEEILQRGYLEGEVEYRVINKDGSISWHGSKLSILERREREIIALGIGRVITERKQAEEKIEYLSFHDSLTGLYNRDYIEEEMGRLDTERQLPISLIMADLNGLKLVNDTYGHYIGDEMLKKSADILKQSTRKEDIVARWGGDEFVILLPQTSKEQADNICKRINDACKDVYIKEVPISIAVGVSTKNDLNKSLEKVIKEAEDEMYSTKLADSRSTKKAILDTLLGVLETKGIEAEKHIELMEEAALKIGEKIGLLESDLKRLSLLVNLHDIGKINIPEGILTKSEPLTTEEWEVVKEHPQIGYKIARSTEEFAHVAEDILAHHERWDGKGYPQGLKGKEIPLLARIAAVAGAYEKIVNKEYGGENVPYDVIEREFDKRAGNSLDPELVDAFIKILKNDGKD